MKRNLDLMRDQLLQIEELDKGDGADLDLARGGVKENVFREHLRLLKEARFIDADEVPDSEDDFTHYLPLRLTYEGHEYLDAVRDPEVWKRTKAIIGAAGGAGLAFAWEIAKAELKRKFNLP